MVNKDFFSTLYVESQKLLLPCSQILDNTLSSFNIVTHKKTGIVLKIMCIDFQILLRCEIYSQVCWYSSRKMILRPWSKTKSEDKLSYLPKYSGFWSIFSRMANLDKNCKAEERNTLTTTRKKTVSEIIPKIEQSRKYLEKLDKPSSG